MSEQMLMARPFIYNVKFFSNSEHLELVLEIEGPEYKLFGGQFKKK